MCTLEFAYTYRVLWHTHRVVCGGEFSIFVTDNGIIMSCGRGDSGALGHGDYKDSQKPKLIEGLLSHDVVTVSCGESHTVVLTSDNSVYAWGAGGCGRLGTGAEENQYVKLETRNSDH